MANMCDNNVIFTGDPQAIENVKALFREMQEKQEQTGEWHLPSYVTAPFSYMQEISINQATINYQMRWHPNFEGLIQIAEHHQLDFVTNYDELSNCIFGQAIYKNKLFNDFRLEPHDFSSYNYDPQTGLYVYENKNYSFEWPIFEQMLEKKKENDQSKLNQQRTSLSR